MFYLALMDEGQKQVHSITDDLIDLEQVHRSNQGVMGTFSPLNKAENKCNVLDTFDLNAKIKREEMCMFSPTQPPSS